MLETNRGVQTDINLKRKEKGKRNKQRVMDGGDELGSAAIDGCSATCCCKNTVLIISLFLFTFRLSTNLLRRICSVRYGDFTFRADRAKGEDEKTTPYCSVCLYEAIDGEKLRKLPKCKHCFHVDCIEEWFKFHYTCPLCRTEVPTAINRRSNKHGAVSLLLNLLMKIGNPLYSDTVVENSTYNLS